jgi:hypothetical protein
MTTVMKIEVAIYYILKVFGYACGTMGALGILGFVGSYEHNMITTTQFFVYELHAFGLCGLSFLLYGLRALVAEDALERARQLRIQRQHQIRLRRQRMPMRQPSNRYN